MNYYIRGNKEKADQIKAAFEELGISADGYDFSRKDVLYFTYEVKDETYMMSALLDTGLDKIILTHPDYTELELPVEPKFKVGDRIVKIGKEHEEYDILEVHEDEQRYNIHQIGTAVYELLYFRFQNGYKILEVQPKFKVGDWLVYKYDDYFIGGLREVQVVKVEDGVYFFHTGTTGSWEFIDKNCRIWTIADSKDGDVLVTTKIRSCPFIYRKTNYNNNLAYYYAGINGNGDFCEGCLKRTLCHFGSVSDVIPATKEQRDLLFAKIKEAGYQWDYKNKELRKIHPHYDISNFKPFQKVLVRDCNKDKWRCAWFSDYDKKLPPFSFITTGADYCQCIPFDGNEHLLGTTDMPSEEYINW